MRTILYLFLWCALAVPFLLTTAKAAGSWIQPACKYRRPVFLDASQLTSDVEQFPLLIRLPADQFDFNHLSPDGTDLVAEDSMTGRVLPHVLEFLPENRGAVLSVQVPRLQGRSVDGLLWLYYGGPARGETEKPETIFDERTLALRFKPGDQGELTVTQPGIILHTEGPVHLAEGVAGAALEVQGDGMVQVELPPDFGAPGTNAWTLEACAYDVNPNPSLGVGHGLISLWAAEGSKPEPLINFGKVGYVIHSDARTGPEGRWVGATNFGYARPGRWFHYAAVYDFATGKVTTYLNGRRAGEGAAPRQPLPVASLRLGGWAPHAFSWQGRIAEVRVATVARSGDWLAASARSLLPEGYLAILGPEEQRGQSPPVPAFLPPVCLEPEDGATLREPRPRLRWSLVPGADHYEVVVSTQADLSAPLWHGQVGSLPTTVCPIDLPQDVPLFWTVSGPETGGSKTARLVISAPEQRPRPKDLEPLHPPPLANPRRLTPGDIDSFRAKGVVGDRVQAALNRWALRVPADNPDLVGMFHHQWHSEGWLDFWGESFGKFFQGASLLYRMTGDARLRELLDREVERALEAQEPTGYLGAYLPERRLFGPGPRGTNWDLYNGHHTLMALLEYHEATGQEEALRAAMWMADLWCDVFGPGRRSIIRDIPGPDQCNLGIIAPLAWLYRLTGRPRYRELAQFVVAEIEAEYGPNWVTLAGQGKHCDEMRGIHALEQLFVFEGLMDLSFITGDPRLREAMLHWWRDMTERERMAHGNLAPEELWHHQPHSPSWAETCVATAYIRFSLQVLYATADPRIADRIEEATLNAYFGAQRPDGVLWAYPVPVNGTRPFGWYELKPEDPDLGCCFTYALTGMGLIPRWASMVAAGDEPALVTHYYGPGASAATVGDVNVRIEQDTRYPCEPEVTLHIRPDRPAEFAVWLRIPDWSTHTRAQVNGEPWLTVPPGKYLKLRRDWGPGDTVTLALDFTPRVVEGSGETSGRVAIYRGPLLLTLDQRFNPDDQSGQSPLEVAHLVLQPYDQAVPGPPPWVLFQAPTVDGREVILCDFASAGALGERYESWIVAR